MLGAVRAELALRRGDPAAAGEAADSALELMYPQSWGVLIGFPLSTAIEAATAMGRHERAAALLDQVVPDTMSDTVFGLRHLRARGRHQLATGRAFAAQADFQRCAELMRRWNLDVPALVPWRGDLAQTHLALGQRRKAHRRLPHHRPPHPSLCDHGSASR